MDKIKEENPIVVMGGENLGAMDISKVCPHCNPTGTGNGFIDDVVCKKCHGTGKL